MVGDIADIAALCDGMTRQGFGVVIHFAGLIEVERFSIVHDRFGHVISPALRFSSAPCKPAGWRRLVFRSSAAVYGHGDGTPGDLHETADKAPASPYGGTEHSTEWMIAPHAGNTACVRSRFAASSRRGGRVRQIGEAHEPESHIIPLAITAALGDGKPLTVLGDDFATPDGLGCGTTFM